MGRARPRPLARRARLQSGAAASVRDLQSFVEHIRDTHGVAIEDIAVVGQSVGAVLAAAWAHDYAPPIRCSCSRRPRSTSSCTYRSRGRACG
jgi:alpha-beta hydrolase superfamily lysophospholipase